MLWVQAEAAELGVLQAARAEVRGVTLVLAAEADIRSNIHQTLVGAFLTVILSVVASCMININKHYTFNNKE
jgi:hypothetical protein